MSKEKVTQPQEPRLIKPVPDIALPQHVENLRETLMLSNTLAFENPRLLVYKTEREITDFFNIGGKQKDEGFEGDLIVYDRKSGLPNYRAMYERKNYNVGISTIHLWDYEIKRDSKKPENFITIESTNTNIEVQPTMLNKLIKRRNHSQIYPKNAIFHTTLEVDLNNQQDATENLRYGFSDMWSVHEAPFTKESQTQLEEVKQQFGMIVGKEYKISLKSPTFRLY